jgi:hypothetical protein
MSDQDNQGTAVVNASSEELLKQAEEARLREEAQAKKEAEEKACREYGMTLTAEERKCIEDYIEAQDEATRKYNDLEEAYDELEGWYSEKASEYNWARDRYLSATEELEQKKEEIDDILQKFQDALESETSDKIIPDPLRQMLLNATESGEGDFDFCEPDAIEEYLEISSPDSDLCDAENLSCHLSDIEKLLPEEVIPEELKNEIKAWGNNYTVFQLHTELLSWENHSARDEAIRFALTYYESSSTWDKMFEELAAEFNIQR